MNGWIKLHRRLLENPIVCKDADHLAVWVYLLLNANHEEGSTLLNGKKIKLIPGQIVTGRKKIAEDLSINESKVRRILNELENDQQIDQQTTTGGRLITLINWAKYQESDQPIDQQVTNERPTSDQRVTTIQECKNVKKDKNKYIYAREGPLDSAIKDFVEHRKKMRKPMTDRAIELFIKRLNDLSDTVDGKILLINTAIERGWQTVYPIKEEEKKNDDTAGYADIYDQYRNLMQG